MGKSFTAASAAGRRQGVPHGRHLSSRPGSLALVPAVLQSQAISGHLLTVSQPTFPSLLLQTEASGPSLGGPLPLQALTVLSPPMAMAVPRPRNGPAATGVSGKSCDLPWWHWHFRLQGTFSAVCLLLGRRESSSSNGCFPRTGPQSSSASARGDKGVSGPRVTVPVGGELWTLSVCGRVTFCLVNKRERRFSLSSEATHFLGPGDLKVSSQSLWGRRCGWHPGRLGPCTQACPCLSAHLQGSSAVLVLSSWETSSLLHLCLRPYTRLGCQRNRPGSLSPAVLSSYHGPRHLLTVLAGAFGGGNCVTRTHQT